MRMDYNYVQTQLTEEQIDSLDKEVYGELIDTIDSIQFLRNLINPNRRRSKDMPKDEEGKIIVDITNPHILEDMDYFRQPAIHFKEKGLYTSIFPNSHPNSAYTKFWREETRRCREGYVRKKDGEWIPGDFYYYLNFSPINRTVLKKKKKRGDRIYDFADIYDGDYLWYHYLQQAINDGEHAGLMKKRGAGFSFKSGSGLSRLFILGDTEEAVNNVSGFAIASEKEYLTKDGMLNKFIANNNWCAEHTPWSRLKLKDSFNDMQWVMGYKDSEGKTKGTNNTIIGVTTQGNPDKARGKRGARIYWEEWGKFPNLLKAWEVSRQSVEEGNVAFGTSIAGGTGGVLGADFRGAEEMIYNPRGYNIKAIPNVFDRNTPEGSICAFFFPAYMNRLGCYDKDGNSDVIKALIEILTARVNIKYNSTDPNTLVQHKAEMPITIQDSIMRREGSIFPVTDLKDHLSTILVDINKFVASHYIGHLKYTGKGNIEWDTEAPHRVIREYPLKEAEDRYGNLEIFEMPRKTSSGEIPYGRYIAGIDPVDSDINTYTNSLASIFIFDLWTDRIVAEYTGRPPRAVEFYEIVLRLLKFYNAVGNYENNIKGLFAYMEQNNAIQYLCETPQILRDMEYVKGNTFGNTSRGTTANKMVNNWARKLQADWMISKVYSSGEEEKFDEQGNKIEKVDILNLHTIRSVGYLKEAISWNIDDNADRVSAMGMCMILREDKIKFINKQSEEKIDTILNDPWFNRFAKFPNSKGFGNKVRFML